MTKNKNTLPHGIIFDIDGVLVDSEDFICKATCLMFEELGLKVTAEDFIPFVGTGENRYIGGVAEKYDFPIDIERVKKRTYDIYLEIIQGALQPLPGVCEFIEKCRNMGKKIAVASSADRRKVLGNLNEIGLSLELFDAIIVGEDVVHKKPAPDIFLLAADHLQLKPEECLVVEDAVSGVTAAKAARSRCLALMTSFSQKELNEADYWASDLSNTPDEVLNWSKADDVNKSAMDYSPADGQPKLGTEVELTKMRRAIGFNLQTSFRDTPHFNVTMSIDMTNAIMFRSKYNSGKEKIDKISVNDLIVKACAIALRQFPAVNSKFMEDKIRYEADVNIGVATALPTGLVVPVVLNTDKLSWKELTAKTKAVIEQARNGKLPGLGKGTFTVSNLGMFGIDEFTAIINPSEVAILTVGGLKQEVVSLDGTIGVKPIMKVTLCSDHRVIDGALSAKFLGCLKQYLEEDIA